MLIQKEQFGTAASLLSPNYFVKTDAVSRKRSYLGITTPDPKPNRQCKYVDLSRFNWKRFNLDYAIWAHARGVGNKNSKTEKQ